MSLTAPSNYHRTIPITTPINHAPNHAPNHAAPAQVVILLLGLVFLNKSRPSLKIIVSVCMITSGCIIAGLLFSLGHGGCLGHGGHVLKVIYYMVLDI